MGFLGSLPALAMGTTTASLYEEGKVPDSQQSYILSKEQTEQIQVSGLVSYSGPRLVQRQNYSIFTTLVSARTWEKGRLLFSVLLD